jgi:chromosomal replication initiation ATPase DnaA
MLASPELLLTDQPLSGADQWETVKNRLRGELSPNIFDNWFGSMQLESVSKGVVHLSVATSFLCGRIRPHKERLLELWQEEDQAVSSVMVSPRMGLHKQKVSWAPAPQPKPSLPNLRPPDQNFSGGAPDAFSHLVSSWGPYRPPPGSDGLLQQEDGISDEAPLPAVAAQEVTPPSEPDPNAPPRRIMVEDVIRVVSKHYGVGRASLISPSRLRIFVRPRQVAMYLARQLTKRTLSEVGKQFGGRDHTTVLNAENRIEALMAEDSEFVKELDELQRKIKAGP